MVYRSGNRSANEQCIGKWLETPLGWARANIIYDKKQGLPVYGTLEEVMFMLVWQKRRVLHAMHTRAVAQSALGGKEAEEAYKDFINELTQTKEESRHDDLRAKLEQMKKIQAIKVTPLETASPKRTLKKVTRK